MIVSGANGSSFARDAGWGESAGMDDVIVIGAGAAGLMAAKDLTAKGFSTTIVEARDRVGGRIWSLEPSSAGFPIDAGAEFIHGRRNDVWEMARTAALSTHEVPDRHWRFARNRLIETRSFWDDLATVLDRINPSLDPEQDFHSWLKHQRGIDKSSRERAWHFAEGFHAAPADRISLYSVATSHRASKETEGDAAFRINAGYGALAGWLLAQVLARGGRLLLGTRVKSIHWRPEFVEIHAETSAGMRQLRARAAVVTLPLGVLKSGAVRFEPALGPKADAIERLQAGSVVKISLLFRNRFWPVDNFGFIHSDEEWLPTWWADERGLALVGWAGGPRAALLAQEGERAVLNEAIQAITRIFSVSEQSVREELIQSFWHDWDHDPFTLGAYSYIPAGCGAMPQLLGEPIAQTLFFAGEATDANGHQGTVHAALASGRRAAAEIAARELRRFAVR